MCRRSTVKSAAAADSTTDDDAIAADDAGQETKPLNDCKEMQMK